MSQINEVISPMKGKLEMIFRNRVTGEIVDTEKDNNVFLNIGMEQMLRAITTQAPTGGSLMYLLDTFKIGDDIGTGTILNPEPAAATYTAADQNVKFTSPYADLTITYPNYYTTEISLVLDGNEVMAQYPAEPDLRFSSAALYSGDGVPFAYRRFQTRTITSEIVIDVKWTLFFDGQGV